MAQGNAPIIIKKKKGGGGDGHHGGAWKVAYADFVTAMMAFFLLMWLLNATTEKQRKGIADYFNPSVPMQQTSGGGDGTFSGDAIFSEETLAKNGVGGSAVRHATSDKAQGQTGTDADAGEEEGPGEQLDEVLAAVEEALSGRSGESMASDELLRHIVTRVTDEGLIVEVFSLPGAPLWAADGTTPTPLMRDLLAMIAGIFDLTTNRIAVNGYVPSVPLVRREDPGWDVSAARAQGTRGLIQSYGLDHRRMERVSGFADREPAHPDPMSVRNDRVELILLR